MAVQVTQREREMILEFAGWKSGWPIWQQLQQDGLGVPSYEEVVLPGTFGTSIDVAMTRPRRTEWIVNFFRQFYDLAHRKMQILCYYLEITDDDLKRKIWTIFEYSIKEKTSLMEEHHLDQLLMCAIYVACNKLAQIKRYTFGSIVGWYRLQPGAHRDVYRHVLIKKGTFNSASNNTTAGESEKSQDGSSQEYGDLIKYYNKVYVPEMKEFVTSSFPKTKRPPKPRL